jgi:probable rRNA maturation factor
MLDIDITCEAGDWAEEDVLRGIAAQAAMAALTELGMQPDAQPAELSLLFTDDAHIQALNREWRDKDKPTNVLSFPAFDLGPDDALPPMLGDIVLAFETISSEASLEQKPFEHHLMHLLIHGLLHLLGYDHETDEDAEEMESIERRALARLAIPDPYG